MPIKVLLWTPEQLNNWLRILVNARWAEDNGVIYFSQELTPGDVANVAFVQNACIFLTTLEELGGTASTDTGNLNRQFVNLMFERLILSDKVRENTKSFCKVLNEPDVWTLHILRILCELAGLVQRRAKHFKVTRAGREIMKEDRTGELYHKLFLTHFRKFDLTYRSPHREVPSIQRSMAVTLWRLEVVAQNWVETKTLAPLILLETVLQDLRKTMRSEHESEHWILDSYILEPLRDFGLIEKKDPESRDHEGAEIRITPLWRKFIHFKVPSNGAPGSLANN